MLDSLVSAVSKKVRDFAAPDRSQVRLAASRLIAKKHCSLWADWEIQQPDRRELAIDWATDLWLDIMNEMKEQET